MVSFDFGAISILLRKYNYHLPVTPFVVKNRLIFSKWFDTSLTAIKHRQNIVPFFRLFPALQLCRIAFTQLIMHSYLVLSCRSYSLFPRTLCSRPS